MDLGDLWEWEKRKLACRVREESHDPGLDDVRERLGDLADRVQVAHAAEEAAAGALGQQKAAAKAEKARLKALAKAEAEKADVRTPRVETTRE